MLSAVRVPTGATGGVSTTPSVNPVVISVLRTGNCEPIPIRIPVHRILS